MQLRDERERATARGREMGKGARPIKRERRREGARLAVDVPRQAAHPPPAAVQVGLEGAWNSIVSASTGMKPVTDSWRGRPPGLSRAWKALHSMAWPAMQGMKKYMQKEGGRPPGCGRSPPGRTPAPGSRAGGTRRCARTVGCVACCQAYFSGHQVQCDILLAQSRASK